MFSLRTTRMRGASVTVAVQMLRISADHRWMWKTTSSSSLPRSALSFAFFASSLALAARRRYMKAR
jgi:hypothetical protein